MLVSLGAVIILGVLVYLGAISWEMAGESRVHEQKPIKRYN